MKLIRDFLRILLNYIFRYLFFSVVLIVLLAFLFSPESQISDLILPVFGTLYLLHFMRKRNMDISAMKFPVLSREMLSESMAFLGIDLAVTWALSVILGWLVNASGNIDIAEVQKNFLVYLIASGILIPIDEEFFFRGYLMEGLSGHSTLKAALLVSLYFGIAHMNLLVAISAFISSMCAIYLRIKYHSLWPGILIHMAVNILNVTGAALNTASLNFIDCIMIGCMVYGGIYLFKHRTLFNEFKSAFQTQPQNKQVQNDEILSNE